jgi:hypothetical protein
LAEVATFPGRTGLEGVGERREEGVVCLGDRGAGLRREEVELLEKVLEPVGGERERRVVDGELAEVGRGGAGGGAVGVSAAARACLWAPRAW